MLYVATISFELERTVASGIPNRPRYSRYAGEVTVKMFTQSLDEASICK